MFDLKLQDFIIDKYNKLHPLTHSFLGYYIQNYLIDKTIRYSTKLKEHRKSFINCPHFEITLTLNKFLKYLS